MSHRSASWKLLPAIVGVLALLMPYSVMAAKWSTAPLLTLAETYTDNVTLSSGKTPKESQWITQINPGFYVNGEGRRLKLSLTYQMQSLFYAGNGGRNNINNQLSSRVKTSLIHSFLFLDASADNRQEVISPSDKVSANNLAIIGNRQDVSTFSLSPYVKTVLFNRVITNIRATQDRVLYGKSNSLNSLANTYKAGFMSRPSANRWSWAVNLSSQKIHYDESTTSTTHFDEKNRDAALDLGYQLSARLRLTAQSGYEDHNYLYSAMGQQPKDSYWKAGAIWSPSARLSISAGNGRRFFGRTWYLNIHQKGRRNRLNVSYGEDLSTRRELQLQEIPIGLIDAVTGEPIVNPTTGLQLTYPLNVLIPTDEVFIDHRSSLTWSYYTRKTTTSLFVTHSKRNYQLSNLEETVLIASILMDRKMTRRVDVSLNVNHELTHSYLGDDQFNTYELKWNSKIGRHMDTALVLLHSRRESNALSSTNNYTENQLTAKFDMKW